jgi:hypothetical protein
MPTFNANLRSRDSEQAQYIADDLDRHGVTVEAWFQMRKFMDDHPDYFRKLTPEEMADGLESVQSLYRDFEQQRWRDYWEQRRIAQAIPLRRLRALRS